MNVESVYVEGVVLCSSSCASSSSQSSQAAFGRGSLSFSGFFTYVGLGLGFLGSALSLPFGIYVLICQRNAERYIQDNMSPIDDRRRAIAAVLVLTAILILLPMAPEIADTAGIGPQSWSL